MKMERRRRNFEFKQVNEHNQQSYMTVVDFWSGVYKRKVSNMNSITDAQSFLAQKVHSTKKKERNNSEQKRSNSKPSDPQPKDKRSRDSPSLMSIKFQTEEPEEILDFWLEKTRMQEPKIPAEDFFKESKSPSFIKTKDEGFKDERESDLFEGENREKELRVLFGQDRYETKGSKPTSPTPFMTRENYFLGTRTRTTRNTGIGFDNSSRKLPSLLCTCYGDPRFKRKASESKKNEETDNSGSFIIKSPKETALRFFKSNKKQNEEGENYNLGGYVSYILSDGIERNCSVESEKIGRILRSCEKENKENKVFKKVQQREMARLKNKFVNEAVHEHMTKLAKQREQAKQIMTLCIYKGSMKEASLKSKLSFRSKPKPYTVGMEKEKKKDGGKKKRKSQREEEENQQ